MSAGGRNGEEESSSRKKFVDEGCYAELDHL